MKLIPKYSYEFNCVLNESFEESDQIKNFASLLSDKERFFALLPLIAHNVDLMKKTLDYDLPEEVEFFVIRAEKFKSFSEPITIEYSLVPEEMVLFLLKEIMKLAITDRFPDELIREQYINATLEHVASKGKWTFVDMPQFTKALHNESQRLHSNYTEVVLDFDKQNLKEHLFKLFE